MMTVQSARANTEEEVTPRTLYLESYHRCQAARGFIPAFYERFLNASEEVAYLFRNTDFKRQYEMLDRSLRLSAAATVGDPHGLQEINARAESHNRHNLDIRPDLYDLWLDSIVATASRFDPEWNPEIEHAWRRILGFVIKHMIARY